MALGQTFYNLSRCLHGSIDTCLLTSHEVFVLSGYRILQNLWLITCKHTLIYVGFWLGIPFKPFTIYMISQGRFFPSWQLTQTISTLLELQWTLAAWPTRPSSSSQLRFLSPPVLCKKKLPVLLQKDFETLGSQHQFAATNSLRCLITPISGLW